MLTYGETFLRANEEALRHLEATMHPGAFRLAVWQADQRIAQARAEDAAWAAEQAKGARLARRQRRPRHA